MLYCAYINILYIRNDLLFYSRITLLFRVLTFNTHTHDVYIILTFTMHSCFITRKTQRLALESNFVDSSTALECDSHVLFTSVI